MVLPFHIGARNDQPSKDLSLLTHGDHVGAYITAKGDDSNGSRLFIYSELPELPGSELPGSQTSRVTQTSRVRVI